MRGMEMLLGAMGLDPDTLQQAMGSTVAAIQSFDTRLKKIEETLSLLVQTNNANATSIATGVMAYQAEVTNRLMNVEAAVLKFELETKKLFSEAMNVNGGESTNPSGNASCDSASGSGNSTSGSTSNDSGSGSGNGSSGIGGTASGSGE